MNDQKPQLFFRSRSLKFEQLDERALLAGDCMAAVNGSQLLIVCDAADNDIDVSFVGGALVVSGYEGTTINGSIEPFDAGQDVDKLNVKLLAGNDRIIVSDVAAGRVMIDAGKGDDRIQVFGGAADDLAINAGPGDDIVGMFFASIGRLELNAGGGDDFVAAIFASIADPDQSSLDGGGGDNDVLSDLFDDLSSVQAKRFEVFS
jgi:hypothetical protein